MPPSKLALVMPVHNGAAFITEALQSALAQTRPPDEIIVVNDGSTDATAHLVEDLKLPNLSLINQAQGGPAAARNAGVAASSAQYIAFLDADDIWEGDKLERQLHVLESRPDVGLVHCSVSYINADGTAISKPTYAHSKPGVWRAMLGFNERYLVRCGSAPLLRRSSFEDLGGFKPQLSFAEDWELYSRLALSEEVVALREPLLRYRQHDSNLTADYTTMVTSFERAIEALYEDVPAALQNLKYRAYGRSFLNVAWRAHYAHDAAAARQLFERALTTYPRLRYSRSGLRFALQQLRSFSLHAS